MTFPYRRQRRGGEVRSVPLVPVELHYGQQHIRVRALVDSGSEHTIFSTQLGELLGIGQGSHRGRDVVLQGLGGTVSGFLAPVELQLGTHRWTTEAIFAYGIAPESGILGQLGFFQFFTVTFSYSAGNMQIRRAFRAV
jgi:hypothetical protein